MLSNEDEKKTINVYMNSILLKLLNGNNVLLTKFPIPKKEL